MNTLKLITIFSTILTSFILLLIIIYFITKNFKSKINNNGNLKISFGIWYASMFLSGANIISNILQTVFELADNLIKIQPTNLKLEFAKSTSLILGIGFIWFVLWLYVVKLLIKLVIPKVDESEEMDEDNFGYFTLRGVMLIGIVFSLSSVLTLILRTFIPNAEIPFYH